MCTNKSKLADIFYKISCLSLCTFCYNSIAGRRPVSKHTHMMSHMPTRRTRRDDDNNISSCVYPITTHDPGVRAKACVTRTPPSPPARIIIESNRRAYKWYAWRPVACSIGGGLAGFGAVNWLDLRTQWVKWLDWSIVNELWMASIRRWIQFSGRTVYCIIKSTGHALPVVP